MAADNQGSSTYVVRLYKLSKTFAVTTWMSCGQYALATKKYLSNSTRAGIIDLNAKTWLLRLDEPHKGMMKYHMNLNYKLTGFRDPHIPVSAGVVKAGEAVTNARDIVGTAAMVAAVVIDAYNVHSAYQEDLKQTNGIGKHTVKAGMSVAGTWVGAYVGANAGSFTGTYAGWAVGSLFGGVGAVPGAAIGSILMSVIGGYGGVHFGKAAGEFLVEDDLRSFLEKVNLLGYCK
ncbi:uncharacterized protein C13G5.2-like [Periplaneta americana]|uniref:uncharacterized protein C13G5.2-like n=1 Tax=Periplaneta americana TaxID=6978 RepID=UPI0037E7EDCE